MSAAPAQGACGAVHWGGVILADRGASDVLAERDELAAQFSAGMPGPRTGQRPVGSRDHVLRRVASEAVVGRIVEEAQPQGTAGCLCP